MHARQAFSSTPDETARLADVDRASLDAELAAAEVQVQELQQELADLSSGRRLGRYAAERANVGDYRVQLRIELVGASAGGTRGSPQGDGRSLAACSSALESVSRLTPIYEEADELDTGGTSLEGSAA